MKFRFLRSLTAFIASLTFLSLVSLDADAQNVMQQIFGQVSRPNIQSLYNINPQLFDTGGLSVAPFNDVQQQSVVQRIFGQSRSRPDIQSLYSINPQLFGSGGPSVAPLNDVPQQSFVRKIFGQAYSRSQSDIQTLYNSNAQRPLGGLFAPGFTRTLTILGGVNFPTSGVSETFDSQLNGTSFDAIGAEVNQEVDNGYALSFAFGRRHSNTLRSELEVAIRGNDIDTVVSDFSGASEETDGSINATSLLKNFIIDFNNSSRFTPYVGVGLGLSFVDIETGSAFNPNGATTFQDDGTLFTYQAIGGVATRITSAADFIVEYRFLGTSEVEFADGRELTYNTSTLFLGAKFEY